MANDLSMAPLQPVMPALDAGIHAAVVVTASWQLGGGIQWMPASSAGMTGRKGGV